MNYKEAMNFIQNTNKFGSVLGLDNIKELLERLGNPQDQLKVVHIAGTNGKGSTLAFLAGIFRESGYRAGALGGWIEGGGGVGISSRLLRCSLCSP